MKRLTLVLASCLFIFFNGCNLTDSERSAQAEDEDAIRDLLKESDYVYSEVDDGDESTFGVDEPNWQTDFAKFMADSLEKRVRFGRKITKRQKTVEVILTSDSTATAHVYWRFEGDFVSVTGELVNDSLSMERFTKPLVHNVERIVNLVKANKRYFADREKMRHRRWKIESISLGNGFSEPNSVSIVELSLQLAGSEPVVITNPLEFLFNRDNLFILPRNDEVIIQVKVDNQSANLIEYPAGSGSFENVRLHYGRNRLGHHAKSQLFYRGQDDNGYSVYTGTWKVKQLLGKHHAIIDVIDNGTIFSADSAAHYNSATWGAPYVIGFSRDNLDFFDRRRHN